MSSNLATRIRPDFPILKTKMNGKPLVYLDNGATTQKPQAVIDALVRYYACDNANIHRGLYELSQRATDHYEQARRKVASLLGAEAAEECIFVRGTTEAINLVASSWGKANLLADDEVIVTGSEHHSNIVPWQMACAASGAKLVVWYPERDGQLPIGQLESLLSRRTKMVAVQHVSNALGTIHDVSEITRRAKSVGSCVLIDGAQWVAHHPTDVKSIDCDFYAFSGHKLYGPTGIGVLWGRREILERMPPYQGGGDMIESVAFERTIYAQLPNRFEAGTPNIAGAIGLGAAIDYVTEIGFSEIADHEDGLLRFATEELQKVPGLRILGNQEHSACVISFVLEQPSIAGMDVATALANEGIAIRTGHHCCMPLMAHLQVSGTCRVSLAMYNTAEEITALVNILQSLVAARRSTQGKADPRAQDPLPGNAGIEIGFAKAQASTAQKAAEELAKEFLEFDDRESKTELLIELGQQLPDLFAGLKAITTPVPGCMSEVYLVGRPMPDCPERFEFAADSNAQIVRGLIGVLGAIFSGQKASEILEFDVERFFKQIGLDQFVSTQRRSGLEGMIRTIRTLAQAILERRNAQND